MPNENDGFTNDSIDILLDHQTQRLEDIANNAVDFIRINLLIIGVFTPFLATLLTDLIKPEKVLGSLFLKLMLVCWVVSTIVSTVVYRKARRRSTTQFETLENAVIDDWRFADLRDEMIDTSSEYEQLTKRLMGYLIFGISFSLMTLLFLTAGVADLFLDFNDKMRNAGIISILILGTVVWLGHIIWSILSSTSRRVDAAIRRRAPTLPELGSSTKSDEPNAKDVNDVVGDISRIRFRLIKALQDVMGYSSWTYNEAKGLLEEEYPNIGFTRTLLRRLVNEGWLIRETSTGPDFYIIHKRRDEVVNGEDLDELVREEINRLIDHLRSDPEAAEEAATALGLDISEDQTATNAEDPMLIENIRTALETGGAPEKMSRLNDVIENISESGGVIEEGPRDYGEIQFIRSAYRYRLSKKSTGKFAREKLSDAKSSYSANQLATAMIQAHQAAEIHLRGLLAEAEESMDQNESLGNIVAKAYDLGLINEKEKQMFERLSELRNQAVHVPAEDLEQRTVESVLFELKNFISRSK